MLLRLLGLDGSRLAAATRFCFIIAAINRFLLDLIDISNGRLFLLVGSDSTALLRTERKKKRLQGSRDVTLVWEQQERILLDI